MVLNNAAFIANINIINKIDIHHVIGGKLEKQNTQGNYLV